MVLVDLSAATTNKGNCCPRAGLIVQNLIEEYLPESAPERASLLRRAKEMKLPENPLVRQQPPAGLLCFRL
jgi:hypothetical protein